MKLSDYRAWRKLSRVAFAQQIGADDESVRLWETTPRIPRREFIDRIARVSKGAVTVADFYNGHR